MRQAMGFVLGLAVMFVGCAPVDEGEPAAQIVLAGGSTVGSCVPDRIVSVYAINLQRPWQYADPLYALDVPCSRDSVYSEPSALAGPACYGPGEPLVTFYQANLLPTPEVAPLDGQAAAPIAGIHCLRATGSFMPDPYRRLYLIVTPAAQLRTVDSQGWQAASWGQRYRRQLRTNLLDWDGYDIPGLYWKETYDRHSAIIFRRDPNTGTWADRIEMGANSFQLFTANQSAACNPDPYTADPGTWEGHTSNATSPWTSVRYVTCSPTQNLFDARAVLSTTGVNPYYAYFSQQGRLGDYVNQPLLGRNPAIPDDLLIYEFWVYDHPDHAPLPR